MSPENDTPQNNAGWGVDPVCCWGQLRKTPWDQHALVSAGVLVTIPTPSEVNPAGRAPDLASGVDHERHAMSDQFPSLADVVAAHRWVSKSTFSRYVAGCSCGWEQDITGTNRKGLQLHGEHVEQVWREACTVTTVEQLDALPDGCVVRDQRGLLWETDQGHMYAASYAVPMCIKAVALPAVIVWHPEWEAK